MDKKTFDSKELLEILSFLDLEELHMIVDEYIPGFLITDGVKEFMIALMGEE